MGSHFFSLSTVRRLERNSRISVRTTVSCVNLGVLAQMFSRVCFKCLMLPKTCPSCRLPAYIATASSAPRFRVQPMDVQFVWKLPMRPTSNCRSSSSRCTAEKLFARPGMAAQRPKPKEEEEGQQARGDVHAVQPGRHVAAWVEQLEAGRVFRAAAVHTVRVRWCDSTDSIAAVFRRVARRPLRDAPCTGGDGVGRQRARAVAALM